jgi:N-ethylmaleimide reductase
MTSPLFQPLTLGSMSLPNRVVMAPMTRSRAIGGVPNELMRDYYALRATAGLIVTEGTAPSPDGLGYARIPGLYSPEQVAGWRAVTDAVHAAGGRIVAQLMHTGRIAHPANQPPSARHIAPSAVGAVGTMWTDGAGPQPMPVPQAMDDADIKRSLDEWATAATNAVAAGFDGIELHAANGYLLEQFLHPHSNRRDDAYGGSAAARNRYLVDVVSATTGAIGAERVGIRLSPHNTYNDLSYPEVDEIESQYGALAEALRGVLYLHVIGNAHAGWSSTAATIRRRFGGPTILNGGFDRDGAGAAIAGDRADLISFGRPFVSNPDLVRRMRDDLPLAEPRPALFFTPGVDGYLDYPTA